mgnify:FL=1
MGGAQTNKEIGPRVGKDSEAKECKVEFCQEWQNKSFWEKWKESNTNSSSIIELSICQFGQGEKMLASRN